MITQDVTQLEWIANPAEVIVRTVDTRPGELYWRVEYLNVVAPAEGYMPSSIHYRLVDCDGSPAVGVDLFLYWGQGIATAQTDGDGRACFRLWDRIDPVTGCGPYTTGVVDESDEVMNLGVVADRPVAYEIVFRHISGN